MTMKTQNWLIVTRNDDEISTSPRNVAIYMILFEQNCNNLKMAAIGRNMQFFLLLNTIINPYYHSCVFMTDIYLTISLSTHNGDDTPQNLCHLFIQRRLSGGNHNATRRLPTPDLIHSFITYFSFSRSAMQSPMSNRLDIPRHHIFDQNFAFFICKRYMSPDPLVHLL